MMSTSSTLHKEGCTIEQLPFIESFNRIKKINYLGQVNFKKRTLSEYHFPTIVNQEITILMRLLCYFDRFSN